VDLFEKVVSLCKRRGFIFQCSEIYGGARSLYDFGHWGALLKENIKKFWLESIVFRRQDCFLLDGSCLLPYCVVKASGHIDSFCDPLVECKKCNLRFRVDKVRAEFGKVQCPSCGSQEVSEERLFNLMFRTNLGPIDSIDLLQKKIAEGVQGLDLVEAVNKESVFLRPETAQNIFTQFGNFVKTYGVKAPFGIAQVGKAFRNEITTERLVFRVAEFEQMELEYFIDPSDEQKFFNYWIEARFSWWEKLIGNKSVIRLREYSVDELAHYAKACVDIEFNFPWGFDEVEGIASRTDFDIRAHMAASGKDLSCLNSQGKKIIPWVIEPSCGLTRAWFAVLLASYKEIEGRDAHNNLKYRVVLSLPNFLAPVKAAIFPLVKNLELVEFSQEVFRCAKAENIPCSIDLNHSIGKRYAKHDEIGTPFCITIDFDSLKDKSVTVRFRDTAEQIRMGYQDAISFVKKECSFPVLEI